MKTPTHNTLNYRLLTAAKAVVANWATGDLAGAVRELDAAVTEARIPQPDRLHKLLPAARAAECELTHWHEWALETQPNYPAAKGSKKTAGILKRLRAGIRATEDR